MIHIDGPAFQMRHSGIVFVNFFVYSHLVDYTTSYIPIVVWASSVVPYSLWFQVTSVNKYFFLERLLHICFSHGNVILTHCDIILIWGDYGRGCRRRQEIGVHGVSWVRVWAALADIGLDVNWLKVYATLGDNKRAWCEFVEGLCYIGGYKTSEQECLLKWWWWWFWGYALSKQYKAGA